MSRRNICTQKRQMSRGLASPYALVLAILFSVVLAVGTIPRLARNIELNQVHQQLTSTIPTVPATYAKQADPKTTLLLPGDTQPIQNIPIYARANGYVVERKVDIGDIVKTGQLLAVISTPELDQQLEQARANLRQSQAALTQSLSDRQNYESQLFASKATISQARTNLEYSNTEYQRYQGLAAEGAISYEQRDQALKQFNSDTAALQVAEHNEKAALAQVVSADARIGAAKQLVEANEHNVAQLKALQGFQNVVAPCDGVITERLVDAGALVAAGGSSGTTQLLSMARTDVLRIYVDVPQSDYRNIHNGDKADILLQEFPGKVFTGTVTNLAGSLNSFSRTLQTELRIDNRNHILRPGSYAQVRFAFNSADPKVLIPSNATITKNDGLYAAVVAGGKVHYQLIGVDRDYGNKVEVGSGLKANDVVLLDAPDNLSEGARVNALLSSTSNSASHS
jgi:RND family efflux transporter MFP subunit